MADSRPPSVPVKNPIMGVVGIYTLTIFLSAMLLFSVQPMFGRMVLPLLGGTPAVWNTCMLFFQTMLLAGYAYAHLSIRLLGDRKQSLVHLLIVLAGCLLLPVGLPSGWTPPAEKTPVFWLLLLLATSVGGPFFIISATTPLLQRWFACTSHPSAGDPYFLYAASNLGSLLALLGYPTVIEPALGLDQQSRFWMAAYFGLAGLLLVCMLNLWLSGRPDPTAETGARESPGKESRRQERRPGKRTQRADSLSAAVTFPRRLKWIALSFVPSSWMLGVTTYLTTDIAPVPLLWVIPLTMYLLTFILVFARREWIPERWIERLFPVAALLLAASVIFTGAWQLMLLHLVTFFVGSMVCHKALARDRPATSHLTEYYFWMSLGGMLGGVFNGLLAPMLFDTLMEYPLTVLLACLLRPSLYPDSDQPPNRLVDLAWLGLAAGALLAFSLSMEPAAAEPLPTLVMIGVPLLLVFYYFDWPQLFAVVVGLLLIVQKFEPPYEATVLYNARSFFGVHWVLDDSRYGGNVLLHGTIVHGLQSHDPDRRCEPLTYYHPTGPLGQVFDEFRDSERIRRVALVGLGAGSAICYQKPDQEFVFYEIDPIVKRLAESPKYFTFLSHCRAAKYEIVLGDGRLNLAQAPEKHYQMMLFDAFSSDSIPIHLLTREALAMYLRKLDEGGLLVFHISNSHVDLKPVMAALAAELGLSCLICDDSGQVSPEQLQMGKATSTYAVLARSEADLRGLSDRSNWISSREIPAGPLWTDDFASLVSVLKWY